MAVAIAVALMQSPAAAEELVAAVTPAETGSIVPALEFQSFQGELLQVSQHGGGQHGGGSPSGGNRGGGGGGGGQQHPGGGGGQRPNPPAPRPNPGPRPNPNPNPRPNPNPNPRPNPNPNPNPNPRPNPNPNPRPNPNPNPNPNPRPNPNPNPRPNPNPNPNPNPRPNPNPNPRPNPGRPGNGGGVPAPRPPEGHRPPPPINRPAPSQPGQPNRAPERLPQRPQPVRQPIGGNARPVEAPRAGPGGRPIHEQPLQNGHGRVIPPTQTHTTIINNRTTINNITVIQNNWNRNDHDYHWHRWGDYDVCHRYWGGYHWWGWYVGPVFFWTPYYNDYYWWYDPYWHRWCWMYNGHWWWHERDVVYIYVDSSNTYSRYDDSVGGVVTVPDTTPPVDAPPPSDNPAPAPDQNSKTFNSGDGTRMVQVLDTTDAKGRAYLYAANDEAADQALKDGVWLGDNVDDVRFQNDSDGKVSRLLTLFKDAQGQESFNLFDKDGNNLTQPPVASAPVTDTPSGEGITDPNDSALKKSPSLESLQQMRTGGNW